MRKKGPASKRAAKHQNKNSVSESTQKRSKESVESKSTNPTEESAYEYWTAERRASAKPLPVPTITPPVHPEESKGKPREDSNQIISEPMGPG